MSAVEFLIELDAQKSLETLQNCYSQKSVLVFKSVSSSQVLRARIENLIDKKVILKLEGLSVDIDSKEILSMKFNVGTQVFFIKTSTKKFLNQYYFDLSTPVVELKRRQQVRYIIPKKWNQSIIIAGFVKNGQPVATRILDLSATGLRIEIMEQAVPFQVNQFIEVQFKIHRRSNITCQVQVRFLKVTIEKTNILGLEFLALQPAQQQKITSLIEDLENFIALDKS